MKEKMIKQLLESKKSRGLINAIKCCMADLCG